ncbi:hypothetical protein Hanom_Chr11g00989861 [Helianthus anomalus]
MASNKNDIHVQFSKLTQRDIGRFCANYGIDPTLETQVPGDRTANECPAGFLVFYTRIVDQPNLRYSFTNFFLEVLKYYRLFWVNWLRWVLLVLCILKFYFSDVLNEKESGVNDLDHRLLLRLHAYHSKLRAYPKELLVMLGISQDWAKSSFEPVLYMNDKQMSALGYILLNDTSNVEINQKEVSEVNPSVVRRNEHVTTGGDFESVPIQPLVDCSSAKKQVAPSRQTTRSTGSAAVASQFSDPISVDSGNEDDANIIASAIGVKPVKKETLEVSSEAGGALDQQISVVLKKRNESKRVVPEKYAPAVDEGKTLKTVLKKKSKGGASKIVSPWKGASVVGAEEPVSSKVIDEKKKKVEEKVDVVSKEKPEVVKGKGPIKANFPVFVPQWNVRVCDTTATSESCHDMLRNMATPAEKELMSKLSDEDSAYRALANAAQLVTSLTDCIEHWAIAASKVDDVTTSLKKKEAELKTSQEDLAAYQSKRVADEAATEELRQRVNQLEEDRKWLIASGLRRFVTYLLHNQEFNLHLAGIYSSP